MNGFEILNKAQEMIGETSLGVREIARLADVSPRWVGRFRQGDFDDPGIKRVQRVYDVLLKEQQAKAA